MGETNRSAHALRGHLGFRRRAGIAAFALFAPFAAGASWADSLALVSGAGQSGLGGSAAQQPLVVEVRDANGAVVAGRTIDWTTSNGFVLAAASSVTDANGQASVGFTYGNYGTTAIVASDPVGANSAQAGETSVGSDSLTLVSGNNQAGKSGSAATQPLVVQLLNASGGPVVGRTINWSDQTAFTHVAAATSVTDASGDASMTFTYGSAGVSSAGNPATIRATNSAAPTQSVDASMTVVGFDSLSFVSGQSQSGLVGTDSAPILVRVTDVNGNPVAGVTVSWSQTAGTAGAVSLSSSNTITDASGQASITFQYLLPTSGTITAQTPVSSPLDAHFAGASAASLTLVSTDNLTGAPGANSATPIVVQENNPDGSPAVGHTITWTVATGNGTTAAGSSLTGGNGQASVGFNFGTVETDFQAADASLPGLRPVIIHTNLTGGTPSDSYLVLSGGNQIGTINTPAAQPILVQVLTPAGRPAVGRTINWTVQSGAAVVSLNAATSVTDAKGQASVSFKYLGTAGTATIQYDDPAGSGANNFVTETATGLYVVSVASGNNQSGLVNTHSAQSLVMKEVDASGNPVRGRTINWSVGSGNVVLDNPTSVTDPSGMASMGFRYGSTAAVSQVVASDPLTVGASGAAHFTAAGVGANGMSMISGNGQTGAPGSSSAQALVVEVRDSQGALVIGRPVTWTVAAGDSTPDAASVATDSFGRASMGFTYGPTAAATSAFVATDTVTGQQTRFTVSTTTNQNHFILLSGDGQTGPAGTPGKQPIVLEVVDPSNQPVPGQAVVWTVVSGQSTLTTVTTTTNGSGQAHANFNYAPTAGTSIIQAAGTGANPMLIQAAVTALTPVVQNDTLSIVSGNNQALIGNIPSSALVVQLKDATNVPVAGATIHWSATNGAVKVPTSITDANGKATNTVTANTPSAAVTVQASAAPLASTPVTFNLGNGLANIGGLTPPEKVIAGALDNSCPALEALSHPTPAQADLLARCKDLGTAAGIDPVAVATALGQLVDDVAKVQSAAAVTAATAQFQNISLRLNALRSSSKTDSLASTNVSLAGLAFAGPGGVIPVTSMLDAFANDDAKKADKQAGSDFSRWGFFATGTIGRGDADPRSLTPAYKFDINGLTAGVDYRVRDNWISGVAAGYSRQNSKLDDGGGHVSMNGWSLSTYSTLSFKNDLYLDGVLTWGSNSFDMVRRIDFTLPTPGGSVTIDQVATSHPGGNLFQAALTFGGDFHKNAWNFSPYAQLISSRMSFDGFTESLQAGLGEGLGLTVNSRSISTFSSVLGTKVSVTRSTSWGVVIPTASLEWQHEFNSPQNSITAHFSNDPLQAAFTLAGNTIDTSFIRFGLGASFVFAHGRSGFVLYEHTFGQDGVRQDNLGLGIRIEF